MLSSKVPNACDYWDTFFFLFWRGGGISYDVGIFVGCVEGTVLDVQFKCIVFCLFFFDHPVVSTYIVICIRAVMHWKQFMPNSRFSW